ncbi:MULTISPECIES: hypothetical protein [unclassified Amycolatopsis]|uniref:hypothetical protein n=1 Tax=unclassified Amycolatopsis TaxID=2618356 RepID=UPI00055D70EC|nr:hypothetical protein [Amycolatopsis sp. Poz14]MCG3755018.1 hypothetical protein [Amycolatopsis sp. Poz14]
MLFGYPGRSGRNLAMLVSIVDDWNRQVRNGSAGESEVRTVHNAVGGAGFGLVAGTALRYRRLRSGSAHVPSPYPKRPA